MGLRIINPELERSGLGAGALCGEPCALDKALVLSPGYAQGYFLFRMLQSYQPILPY